MKETSFRNDILPHKDKLFRLAFRITLNRAEAEDIVQDTLIKVWEQRESLAEVKSIEAYCMTICRNHALDRSEKKENQNIGLDEQLHDVGDSYSTPSESLINRESLELVERMINNLPERQRTIMQLRDIEEKSYKEIAIILGITEEQVKVNLFRARQRIKERFS
ncbi:MAG: RNA polymerase sigma factor, partial [Paludibacteraceae bacterium]|nr:RNA polymerase sigma factor [Paludibacteraceae bacterium]